MQMPRQVKVFFLILLFNSGIDTKLLGIVTWLAIIKRGGRKLKPNFKLCPKEVLP